MKNTISCFDLSVWTAPLCCNIVESWNIGPVLRVNKHTHKTNGRYLIYLLIISAAFMISFIARQTNSNIGCGDWGIVMPIYFNFYKRFRFRFRGMVLMARKRLRERVPNMIEANCRHGCAILRGWEWNNVGGDFRNQLVHSFIKSQVTYRTCLQSMYRLYEIRPTGPTRRLGLATR